MTKKTVKKVRTRKSEQGIPGFRGWIIGLLMPDGWHASKNPPKGRKKKIVITGTVTGGSASQTGGTHEEQNA